MKKFLLASSIFLFLAVAPAHAMNKRTEDDFRAKKNDELEQTQKHARNIPVTPEQELPRTQDPIDSSWTQEDIAAYFLINLRKRNTSTFAPIPTTFTSLPLLQKEIIRKRNNRKREFEFLQKNLIARTLAPTEHQKKALQSQQKAIANALRNYSAIARDPIKDRISPLQIADFIISKSNTAQTTVPKLRMLKSTDESEPTTPYTTTEPLMGEDIDITTLLDY